MRFVRSVLCALLLCLTMTLPALAAAPVGPNNTADRQNYYVWAETVTSHLYFRPDGGLTRVERTASELLIQNFTHDLEHLSTRSIPLDLPRYGGFFAGEDYLYVITGQSNWEEDDSREVIRVTQYDHNWNRLGHASLCGANTVVPFDGGSLRCDEYNGHLYVRTCHQMYASPRDGLNHQANLTLALRQEDMTITDAAYTVWNNSTGYVSHSFNQFLLVDEDGYLVAADHGDAHPRGIPLFRYRHDLDTSPSQVNYYCSKVELVTFPGERGDNTTGASLGGLAETSAGYVALYNYDGTGGQSGYGGRHPYFQFVSKDLVLSDPVQLSEYICHTPVLAPTGLDGGWVLWNDSYTDTLHYALYDAQGNVGETQTVEGVSLSDCQPIPYEGGVLWYVVKGGTLYFHHLTEDGLTTLTDFPDAPPAVQSVPGGELYYDPYSGVVVGCSEGLTRLEIPAELGGFSVPAIGHGAFAGQETLTEVILPDTVTYLGESCFEDCIALTEITIPNGATAIPAYAFAGCAALTGVGLPDTLAEIGMGAFAGCTSLTDLYIPDRVGTIGEQAFQFCTALTDLFLPESLTHMDDYAFRGCSSLRRVVLPATLTQLYDVFPECDALEQVLYTGTPAQWGEAYVSWLNPDIFSRDPIFVQPERPAAGVRLYRGDEVLLAQSSLDRVTLWLARYGEKGSCTQIETSSGPLWAEVGTSDWKLFLLDEDLAPIIPAIGGTK